MGTTQAKTRILNNVGHGVNDTYFFILPIILPFLLDKFNIPYGTAGLILSCYLLVISIGHYLFGKLSDSTHHGIIIGTGFYLTSIAFIASALVPTFTLFIAGLFVAAVGVSTFHPVVYARIDIGTPKHRGRAMGNFEMWGNATLFVMFFLSGMLLRQIGWKGLLIVFGLPGLIVGYFFLRERFSKAASSLKSSRADHSSSKASIPVAFFAVFLIGIMLRVIGTFGLLSFIPAYLVNALGLHPDRAALLAGLGFAGGLICAPITGRTADKIGPLPVLLVVTGALVPIIFLFGLSTTRWLVPFFIIFFGGALGGCYPPQNMILSRIGSKLGSGEVFGLLMAAVALAQSFSPALFGALADRFGLEAAIRITSLLVLPGFVMLLIFSRSAIVRRALARQGIAR